QSLPVRLRAHHKVCDVTGYLRLGEEYRGPRLRGQPIVPDVARHTHDLSRRRIGPIADNALADRILARTILVHERLIHHRDARASHAVLPAKRPAAQNWDAHGGKVSAADCGYVGLHHLRRRGLLPSDEVERTV